MTPLIGVRPILTQHRPSKARDTIPLVPAQNDNPISFPALCDNCDACAPPLLSSRAKRNACPGFGHHAPAAGHPA